MALTFVKRSEIPAAGRGKAGSLSVVVTKTGQLLLSSLASKALNGAKDVFIAFDGGKCHLVKPTSKLAAKMDTKYAYPVRHSKKGGTVAITAGGSLDNAAKYGASGVYDFRKSGNQTFSVQYDEKNEWLVFELPAGSLTPKPVQKRVKKVKPASSQATPDSPNTLQTDEEIELIDAA